MVGTWLHDIGKGFPGDHTVVGMEIVADIGARMGFAADDVDLLVAMVEHHLLLPDVATRRDLDDPEVINGVAEAVGEHDAARAAPRARPRPTRRPPARRRGDRGSASWSTCWSRRVEHVLAGGEVDDVTEAFPNEEQQALVMSGRARSCGARATR